MNTVKRILALTVLAGLLVTLSGFGFQKEAVLLAQSQALNEATVDYRYNDQGQLTRKIQDTLETRYQYYDDGTLKAEVSYDSGMALRSLEYDRKGTLARVLEVDGEGLIHIVEECDNHYDDQGRLTSQTHLRADGTGEDLLYTYGEDGTYTIELSDYYADNGSKVPHCHRTATFTKDGTLIASTVDLVDMTPCQSEFTVKLDRRGNPESSLIEETTGDTYRKIEYTYNNSYNASGKLLQRYDYVARYTKTGSKVEENVPATLQSETEYVYDAKGRLINERLFYPDQGYGSSRKELAWEYDSQGNLTRYYGEAKMSDVDYFFQGKGERYYSVDESYTYAPLSQLLDTEDTAASASITAVDGGLDHTVVLFSDGTVKAIGSNTYGQCDLSSWQDIVQISTLKNHTVGLRRDGTVVAAGDNREGQCDVSEWNNIVAVSAGDHHTVGLKADGTVVAVGKNQSGECNVEGWTNVVSLGAAYTNTFGLCSDGTVIATGSFSRGKLSGFENIVKISVSDSHIVGLKPDGTVKAAGNNSHKQCNLSAWKDIVEVYTGCAYTTGLKSDGSVVVAGINDVGQHGAKKWEDMRFLGTGLEHTIGLRNDNTLLAVGANDSRQCNVQNLH